MKVYCDEYHNANNFLYKDTKHYTNTITPSYRETKKIAIFLIPSHSAVIVITQCIRNRFPGKFQNGRRRSGYRGINLQYPRNLLVELGSVRMGQ